MNIKGLWALSVESELKELEVVLGKKIEPTAIAASNLAIPAGVVKLKRTFTMFNIRFWRVIAPATHPNYMSDLSELGLKDWGIIKSKETI